MTSKPATGILVLCALVLAPSPSRAAEGKPAACPEGQLAVKGQCVPACPTQGAFKEDSCECPPKFGKVFFGNGSAECRPALCPKTGEFATGRACDCPQGYAKKAAKKGNVKCVATAPAKKSGAKTVSAAKAGAKAGAGSEAAAASKGP
jgi:hypothetical protein